MVPLGDYLKSLRKLTSPSFPLVSKVAHEFLSSMHLSHYYET